MRLSELISGMNCCVYNFKDVNINSIELDSRKVRPGCLFVALKGNRFDGHNFIKQAEESGAVALATQKKVDSVLPQIIFDDTRDVLGKIARRFYGEISGIKLIGVTGTNGKTTTTFIIHSILKKANYNPGLIGTIYYMNGKEKIKAERTTPESLELFKLINEFQNNKAKAVVMEVSSHALQLKRVEELNFYIGIFTNLSQDHLDFHKTMEEYKKAKLHLFDLLTDDGYAIYNQDDPVAEDIKGLDLKNLLNYGFRNEAMIRGEIKRDLLSGISIEVFYRNKKIEVNSKLIGSFNGYNILAGFATGIALGVDLKTIKEGIEELDGVRGRMEKVAENIFVDFAHTPEALSNLLKSLRKYTIGRLIVIFGCGGDRDRDKRPKMGRVASENADFVIVTSDNPRSEDPEKIIADIIKGMTNKNYTMIQDREEAIAYGISIKKPDDILVIAGKGHEEYQILKDKVVSFDDAAVVRKYLRRQ
uniref:UDP-N-acetylmuramoyl-L-alanyl-D-glutamate--2,6-diaminopimelate ligase n=1 Tax=candidate division WOR-3 bacterium TaxID=2052148 RepID=A0A7V3VU99_UNCW3